MQKILIIISLSLGITLSGCSVHRIDIQQGNIVTQDMVDKLQLGMDKRQVRYLLGTPLLEDPFRNNRWDYFYSLKRYEEPLERYSLRLFFEGDKLTRIEGDVHPGL